MQNYQTQNIAFTLFERSHDYKNSLQYINMALDIWIKLKDRANETNLHKFKGLQFAHLYRIDDAKEEVRMAI